MSRYWNELCTLTLGTCMKSTSLPASYYFIWLFFKCVKKNSKPITDIDFASKILKILRKVS